MRVRLVNRRQNGATALQTSHDNIFSEVSDFAAPRGIPARMNPIEPAQVLRPEAFTLGGGRSSARPSSGHNTAVQAQGIACLQADAEVITQSGVKALGDLSVSDRVLTRDNGFQPVLWVGAVASSEATSSFVEIAPDAVMGGKPDKATIVSARQTVLLTCADIPAQFGSAEVLARAGDLLHLDGVRLTETAPRSVAVLMGQHELLNINGLWMDSLLPDSEALTHLAESDKDTIKSLLPDLGRLPFDRCYPAARTVLRPEFARQFTR